MQTEAELLRELSAAHRAGRAAQTRRIELLRDASRALDADRFDRALQTCWRRGDARERCAILRALPELVDPARHVRIGTLGVRSNLVSVFEAIATENPYPAQYFSEPQLNQMVIKALFLGVDIERIAGLDRRVNNALRRMAADFASERRAAGRSVPSDALALAGSRLAERRSR